MKDAFRKRLLIASSISFGLAIANICTAIIVHDVSSIYYGWIGLATLFIGYLIHWVIYQDDKE
jgi:hypothetical protein